MQSDTNVTFTPKSEAFWARVWPKLPEPWVAAKLAAYAREAEARRAQEAEIAVMSTLQLDRVAIIRNTKTRIVWRNPQPITTEMDIFSHGMGVDSMAAMVLSAQGRLPRVPFVFANVGPDSEDPLTLAYLEDYARPYALRHGIDLIETWRMAKDGAPVTLLQYMVDRPASVPIPMRVANGSPAHRACTQDWKSAVVARWAKAHGFSKEHPARLGIGVALEEMSRSRTSTDYAHIGLVYPLLALRLDRSQCTALIRAAGLPVPPKSACWWCPFKRLESWGRLKQERPSLFRRACALERLINMRRKTRGQHPLWLTDKAKPLAVAVGDLHRQLTFTIDQVESGASCAPFGCVA